MLKQKKLLPDIAEKVTSPDRDRGIWNYIKQPQNTSPRYRGKTVAIATLVPTYCQNANLLQSVHRVGQTYSETLDEISAEV